MSRKKTGRRRGRPPKADKKPRPPPGAGRPGLEVADLGTAELQARRLLATRQADLPIDKTQYLAGRDLGELLEVARGGRGLGLPDAGCHASWLAILAGGRSGDRKRSPQLKMPPAREPVPPPRPQRTPPGPRRP
jgi:hypothetical protein